MRRALAAVTVCAGLLAGCGGSSSHHGSSSTTGPAGAASTRSAPTPVSLVLDFTPNAVHTGIYEALARHFDTAAGIRLSVKIPGASTDAISELRSGRVDFAILDIHDLAIADAKGAGLRAVMPIVQRPLAAVVAGPSVASPRALQGRTVGVTGDPSDLAVLRSEVAGSGGDPRRVHTIDIGFNAVADVLTGKVAAATAFWNDEGVTLRQRGGRSRYHVFRVDDYGAPAYPELVVCATARSLQRDPARARAPVTALRRGYQATVADPGAAAHALESQVHGLDPSLVSAELPGLVRAFAGPERRVGVFDVARLRRWARWEARFGIVKRAPDVGALFDTAL